VAQRVRVAALGEIPAGTGKGFDVEGRLLAVFHAGDGRYYASSAVCPHEDGPLDEGLLQADKGRPVVLCPWHAFDFDLATGACSVDPDLNLAVYPVVIEGGDLFVELPEGA
jgi:NAD(P)H-dependent nitrite reductase small subunit